MSEQVRIVETRLDRRMVTVGVMGVEISFILKGSRLIETSRRKTDAQVFDRSECWLPNLIYRQACRAAAAVLKQKKKAA